MLYNKSAVKIRVPVTAEQIKLARAHSPFKLKKAELEEIIQDLGISKRLSSFLIMERVANELSCKLGYDDDSKKGHYFEGFRTAYEVWKDRKGHCIEQNTLFYAIVSRMGIKTKWLVTKNPKGYSVEGLVKIGVHPFLMFKKNDKAYLADAIKGQVKEKKDGFHITEQLLSQREFIAFYLQLAAEDLEANHRKYQKAIRLLKIAQQINPNDYTIHVSMGDTFYNKGCKEKEELSYTKAEQSYKRAVRMAPNLMDPYKEYGDFLFLIGKKKRAIQVYKEAIKHKTEDLEILYSLEKRLRRLGKTKLFRQVYDARKSLTNSEKFRGYFD